MLQGGGAPVFFEAWDWFKNGWDFSAQIDIFSDGETDDNHHWKIRNIPFFRPSSALPETGVLR